ncbi:hypothetical protein [Nocardia bovistercoris]|uniref:Mce-associated membrane protein n=1 Tax=Nocardia bovistercoris TaxID=2785916 RepID=A0A931I9Y8_9NOCA|nr:hypothetical protein [Nocardia bovistercoris]MBH0776608.1 hypothetical protein [Nocardia bovistercoris]
MTQSTPTTTEKTEPETISETDAPKNVPSDDADTTTENESDSIATGSPSTPAPDRRGLLLRLALTRVLPAALLILTTVAAVVFGWKDRNHNEVDRATTEAAAAARHYAVALTTIDADRIDESFAAIRDGATGEFADMYTRSSDQLKPLLLQARSKSVGHVVDSGVRSASEDRVVVLLFVDAEISNTSAPEPGTDRSRLAITMRKVGDRWLAEKVDVA